MKSNEPGHATGGGGERWLFYLGSEGTWHWQFEHSPGRIVAYSVTRFVTRADSIANASKYGYPSALDAQRAANQSSGVKWFA